jgi:hypothetical protein
MLIFLSLAAVLIERQVQWCQGMGIGQARVPASLLAKETQSMSGIG